ncbi:hypothetical protein FQZ97_1106200 [compost metagenome]
MIVQKHAPGLLESLAKQGLGEDDIHVVVLTHLQALLPTDACAAVQEGETPRLLFPNARYVTAERHWLRARRPHPRDRFLFVPQILRQLEGSGRLELIGDGQSDLLGSGWHFHFSDGHTPGQLLNERRFPPYG